MGGVFTLGEATAEQITIIRDKTEKLKVLKAERIKQNETETSQIEKKDTLENDFKEAVWTKLYKKYESTFY